MPSKGKKNTKRKADTTSYGAGGQPGCRGLRSAGLSCFFNAVLQSLLSLKQIQPFISSSHGPISSLFSTLYAEYWDPEESSSVLNPLSLYSSLCRFHPRFGDYGQHDSFELFISLLSTLTNEQTKANSESKLETLFSFTLESRLTCMCCGTKTKTNEPFINLPLSIFNSSLRTRKPIPKRSKTTGKAKRNNRSYDLDTDNYDPITNSNLPDLSSLRISPPSPFSLSDSSLNSLILHFIYPEMLAGDNAAVCKVCTSRERKEQAKMIISQRSVHSRELVERAERELEKKTLVSNESEDEGEGAKIPRSKLRRKPTLKQYVINSNNLPEILTIQIKRFRNWGNFLTKDDTLVEFPEILNISDYTNPEQVYSYEEPNSTVYHLQAVVSHSGSLNGGHYVAYTKCGDKWRYFSDSCYQEVSLERVLACEAYLLFYIKSACV
ncbi:hypothetical protein RCL1_004975 [Eukaryota sp. TZLM3-RCL]